MPMRQLLQRNYRAKFSFPGWEVIAPHQGGARHGAELKVTDVSVQPDNKYCFHVRAGARPVATFCFDGLSHATKAARDLVRLLPQIRAVLGRR